MFSEYVKISQTVGSAVHGGLLNGGIIEQITDELSDFILIVGILLVKLEVEFLNGEVGLSFPLHNFKYRLRSYRISSPSTNSLTIQPQKTFASLKQQR